MLHSLDSVKLAGRLERFCGELNRNLPVLLEFNVSGEESKFGFPAWEEQRWPDLEHEMEQILAYPHLHVCGLMTMPPFFDDPEQYTTLFPAAAPPAGIPGKAVSKCTMEGTLNGHQRGFYGCHPGRSHYCEDWAGNSRSTDNVEVMLL